MGAQKHESFLDMVIKAIPAIKDRKGASRMGIASWIQDNYNKEAGKAFNNYLRTALKKGMDSGVLTQGQTEKRFRIGVLPKAPKKKTTPKKKTSSKKKGSKKKSSSRMAIASWIQD